MVLRDEGSASEPSTPVTVPEADVEAARDLVRARTRRRACEAAHTPRYTRDGVAAVGVLR